MRLAARWFFMCRNHAYAYLRAHTHFPRRENIVADSLHAHARYCHLVSLALFFRRFIASTIWFETLAPATARASMISTTLRGTFYFFPFFCLFYFLREALLYVRALIRQQLTIATILDYLLLCFTLVKNCDKLLHWQLMYSFLPLFWYFHVVYYIQPLAIVIYFV